VRPPRTLPSDEVDRHRLGLGVVLHHFLAHLAAPSRLLEAAERPGRIAIIVAVDADRAGLACGERMGDLQIMGPDARDRYISKNIPLSGLRPAAVQVVPDRLGIAEQRRLSARPQCADCVEKPAK
jgi:hypothetical protein